jgi:hypothetical protein
MTNEEAQSAYMRAMAAITAKLEKLEQWADGMGDVTPEEVHWGHVGDAAHIAHELETLVAFIENRG